MNLKFIQSIFAFPYYSGMARRLFDSFNAFVLDASLEKLRNPFEIVDSDSCKLNTHKEHPDSCLWYVYVSSVMMPFSVVLLRVTMGMRGTASLEARFVYDSPNALFLILCH